MKYNFKKIIAAFMAATLIAAGSANCMFVGANTMDVPYNESNGEFRLDSTTVSEDSLPEVTMGIDLESSTPPGPEKGDLTIEWGDLALKYVFTVVEDQGDTTVTGGSWSGFDGTNNKVTLTNNSTSKSIKGQMRYTNTPETDDGSSRPIDEYDTSITLANYNSETEEYFNSSTTQEFTIGSDGNVDENPNSVSFYVYCNTDLAQEVINGNMAVPEDSIASVRVGVITVQAAYLT